MRWRIGRGRGGELGVGLREDQGGGEREGRNGLLTTEGKELLEKLVS